MFGRLTATLRTLLLGAAALWLLIGAWQIHQHGWGAWLQGFVLGGLPPLVIGYLLGRARGSRHGRGETDR